MQPHHLILAVLQLLSAAVLMCAPPTPAWASSTAQRETEELIAASFGPSNRESSRPGGTSGIGEDQSPHHPPGEPPESSATASRPPVPTGPPGRLG